MVVMVVMMKVVCAVHRGRGGSGVRVGGRQSGRWAAAATPAPSSDGWEGHHSHPPATSARPSYNPPPTPPRSTSLSPPSPPPPHTPPHTRLTRSSGPCAARSARACCRGAHAAASRRRTCGSSGAAPRTPAPPPRPPMHAPPPAATPAPGPLRPRPLARWRRSTGEPGARTGVGWMGGRMVENTPATDATLTA